MDENRRLQPPGNAGCGPELTRTNSDATSSAVQNCEDIMCSSESRMPDDGAEWTNEKHNLYLHQLEASFVKQLHQSKSMLARCSEQSQRRMHIYQKKLINTNKACEEVKFNTTWNGYWQKIKYAKCDPLSSNASVDSGTPLISEGLYNFPCMGMHYSAPSTDMPEFLKHSCVMKYGEGKIAATSLLEFSHNKPSSDSLFGSTTEGTGQNFLDEDIETSLNFESLPKRQKTVEDISIQRST